MAENETNDCVRKENEERGRQLNSCNEIERPTCVENKPSRLRLLRSNTIQIEFLESGCIVRIGCKSVAFTTIDEAWDALGDYISNTVEEYDK